MGTGGVVPYQTGPEIAVDGEFNEASNWDQVSFPGEDAGWTVAGGNATKVAGIRGTKINQNAVVVAGGGLSITPGTTYLVTYTVTDYTGVGSFQVRLGDVSARSILTDGEYTDVITTDMTLADGNYINIVAVLDGMGASFDSISVKAILSGDTADSSAVRGMFVEPVAARPFPIYASVGQALASASGGLTFDADGRLRVTGSIPAAPVNLSGGLIADSVTEALVCRTTDADVWHQGVILTEEGYLGVNYTVPVIVENDFDDVQFAGGYN